MGIAKGTADRLLGRSDPDCPLFGGIQDDVFIENIWDHSWEKIFHLNITLFGGIQDDVFIEEFEITPGRKNSDTDKCLPI